MCKTELIAFVLLFSTLSISAKNEYIIQAKVDERIELLSVVCRLAEYEEYVNNNIPDYAKEVDQYFEAYKSHALISLAKKLKTDRGISYDAIASIATSIKIGKEIKLKDNLLPIGIDKRWSQENIDTFIIQLNSFYQTTNFNEFYSSHKELYSLAEKKFAEILDNINFLHPFREGNGRTQREFIRLLALEKGLILNLNPADNEDVYKRYMKGTINSDLNILTSLIFELINK